MTASRQKTFGIVLLLCSASLAAAQSPAVLPLRMAWSPTDHPSGIYHAKEMGTLELEIENPGDAPATLGGSIAFGLRLGNDSFKTLSMTPIKPTRIDAGARAKIPVPVTFAGAGTYALRWVDGDPAATTPGIEIPNAPAGAPALNCIFAPRTAPGSPLPGDPRWLAALPAETVRTPGLLRDLATQTGVQKFLLDERFAFDDQTGVALPLGTALNASPEGLDTLFAQAAAAKIAIVLRLTVPMAAGVGEGRGVEALHQYIANAIRRGKGSIVALVIAPEKAQADRATFRAFYLAAYGAAKGITTGDRNLAMLGAGTLAATRDLLLADGLGLSDYVDALAVTDTITPIAAGKLPLWVLPPTEKDPWSSIPAAVALAQGAAVVAVPPPAVDHGVIEHLLGGAAWYQTLTNDNGPASPPYVTSFQGDGYAVAAVAGLGAGTPLDSRYPALAHTRSVVSPLTDDGLPPYPQLELGDSSGSMRVVDDQGAAVDCRQGDTLYVPAAERPVYVLQSGSAEDLTGVLRSGHPHHQPLFEIAARRTDTPRSVTLRLTNITENVLAGALRLFLPGDKTITLLGEAHLEPVASGQSQDITLPLRAEPPTDGPVIVEITTGGAGTIIQRTALKLP